MTEGWVASCNLWLVMVFFFHTIMILFLCEPNGEKLVVWVFGWFPKGNPVT